MKIYFERKRVIMKQNMSQNLTQETPLLIPKFTPLFPFKNKCEHFVEGCGEYILRDDAYTIFKQTIGLLANKSKLKAFLAKECNISDPTNYSFPDIIAALKLYIQNNDRNRLSANTKDLLPERQLEIWNSLKEKCLSAKELGKLFGLSEENIRKHIQAIRKKRGEHAIENTRSRGYWRPDSPPADIINKS